MKFLFNVYLTYVRGFSLGKEPSIMLSILKNKRQNVAPDGLRHLGQSLGVVDGIVI